MYNYGSRCVVCSTTSSLSSQRSSTVEWPYKLVPSLARYRPSPPARNVGTRGEALDWLIPRLAEYEASTYVLQILFTACAGIREHAVSILAIDEVVRSLQGVWTQVRC